MGEASSTIMEAGSGGWVVLLDNFDRSSYTSQRTVREHTILNMLDRVLTFRGGDCCGGVATSQFD